jgi:hypothetical protein
LVLLRISFSYNIALLPRLFLPTRSLLALQPQTSHDAERRVVSPSLSSGSFARFSVVSDSVKHSPVTCLCQARYLLPLPCDRPFTCRSSCKLSCRFFLYPSMPPYPAGLADPSTANEAGRNQEILARLSALARDTFHDHRHKWFIASYMVSGASSRSFQLRYMKLYMAGDSCEGAASRRSF